MKQILIIAFAATLLACNNSQRKDFSRQEIVTFDEFIQSIPERLPVPGIAVVIVKDEHVYTKVSGHISVDDTVSLTDSSLFFTGNISELMLATAILKMAENNIVELDNPVYTYLPDFQLGDSSYKKITIRHLLTHTSGVPYHDVIWDMPYQGKDALFNTMRSVRLQHADFPAGSRVKRNPYNYDILASLIEKLSGVSFEDYMEQAVFKPMGMNSSTYLKSKLKENLTAKPHEISNWLTYTIKVSEHYPQNREHAGSIGFHATVKDLSAWLYMLMHQGITPTGKFLKASSVDELFKIQVKTGTNSFVGFATDIIDDGNLKVLQKSHDIGGFSASLKLIPQDKTAILVLSNISGEFNPNAITDKLLSGLHNKHLGKQSVPVCIPMGKRLEATGELDSAFAVFTNLKNSQPDIYDSSEEALSQLGFNLFFHSERKADAIKVYELCERHYPHSALAKLNLAEAYLLMQDTVKAKSYLKQAEHFVSGNKDITERLAYVKMMAEGSFEADEEEIQPQILKQLR